MGRVSTARGVDIPVTADVGIVVTEVGTVVSTGLISGCVGLVQPAESAQRQSPSDTHRIMVLFMKSALFFFIFLICARESCK